MKRYLLCFSLLLCFAALPAVAQTVCFGGYIDYAITEDGTLLAWGEADYGLLGEGRTSHQNPAVLMENARSAAGARDSVLVIDRENVLWGIGTDWFGVLAGKSNTDLREPAIIMQDVLQISAGEQHCLAVKTDGSLWCWGLNVYGQLGEVKPDTSQLYDGLLLPPTKLMHGVKEARCSTYGSYAITWDGKLLGWGSLPTGDIDMPVVLATDVLSIETSGFIKTDHSLWLWTAEGPEWVMDDVIQCTDDTTAYAAIKTDGSLWTWGTGNRFGQLGNGTLKANAEPQKVMDNVLTVVSALEHTLILKEDGSLWQIGYPNTMENALPELEESLFYTPYRLMDGILTETEEATPDCPTWLHTLLYFLGHGLAAHVTSA